MNKKTCTSRHSLAESFRTSCTIAISSKVNGKLCTAWDMSLYENFHCLIRHVTREEYLGLFGTIPRTIVICKVLLLPYFIERCIGLSSANSLMSDWLDRLFVYCCNHCSHGTHNQHYRIFHGTLSIQ